MPGAEGRTGWPWDGFPWQLNWGFIILELSPFLMLLFILVVGSMSNRLKFFRRKRGAVVEDFAGAVQENGASPVPYFLVGIWVVIAISVLIYTINNGIFGEQY
jgi:hypothetical protein